MRIPGGHHSEPGRQFVARSELAEWVMSEIIGQGAPLLLGWFALQVSRGRLRPVDPTLVIQAFLGPSSCS